MKKYGVWLAIGIAALVLVGAGGAKLAGVPEVHRSFFILGLPPWFGYFIGVCEIAGAIGLFIRPLSAAAAAGIIVIMLGALYFHGVYTPMAQGIPALVVMLLCGYIVAERRTSLFLFGKR